MGKCYLWHINGCSLVLLPEGCAAEDPVYKIAFQAALHHTAFFCIGPCVCANVLRSKETSRWKEPPILTSEVVHSLKIKMDCLESSLRIKHVDLYFLLFEEKKNPICGLKKKRGKNRCQDWLKIVRSFSVGGISCSVKLLFPSSVSMTVQHTQDMQQTSFCISVIILNLD